MAKKKTNVNRTVARKNTPKKTIEFHYQKPDHCPTYPIDGIFGGVTPRLEIYLHAFIERQPLPKVIHSEISGVLVGKEVRREVKAGIIRDVQFGAKLNIETAKTIGQWLLRKAEEAENLKNKLTPKDK